MTKLCCGMFSFYWYEDIYTVHVPMHEVMHELIKWFLIYSVQYAFLHFYLGMVNPFIFIP